MPDWLDDLDAKGRQEWDEFAQHARETVVPGMGESAFVMSLVPSGEPDIKFCLELGLTIMMEKPMVIVAQEGQDVPPKLLLIADHVIRVDMEADPQGSAERTARELAAFMQAHPQEEV